MTPFTETNSEPALDDIRHCPIQLDGQTTLVTANLRDALRSSFGAGMKSVGTSESRYLWIDALCIYLTGMYLTGVHLIGESLSLPIPRVTLAEI